MSFTHLHVHSEYSLLDGACRIEPMLDKIKSMGQNSVAITDHGVMYGVIDFYNTAKSKGIKPIIGCEVYVAPRTRFDKTYGTDNERFHLILLCENNLGYKNLCKIVSSAWTEGFYVKPRVDIDLLEKHHKGIIALSGCYFGEVSQLISKDDYEGAKNTALKYQSIFGKDNYFLEIQNHGLDEQLRINADLIKLSRETGIKLVATNDAHYINKEDSKIQQILICIATNHIMGEDTGFEFGADEFYLKSEEEMLEQFFNCKEAISNTQIIADRCNVDFEFGNTKLPFFNVPDGYTHIEWFNNMCREGLKNRYGNNPPEEYIQRMEYELNIINSMGYTDYYLIVHDFINYAKSNGIPVGPGRGSGAASICAYSIGITGIDPMKYNLLFERFLNPERVSMPDFDIDFCFERREEVIDYVTKKYGSDHVAQIVTFGTLAAKAAVRDVGRVLGLPYSTVDSIAKLIPSELNMSISKAIESSKELSLLYETNNDAKEILDYSIKVEGMPRHASTHAAGVVITDIPTVEYVPLATNDNVNVTQYTMKVLEKLGLLKMDFLGLRTLTVIDKAIKSIKLKNKNFDINNIDISDSKVFELISKADTNGVFQLESAGMKRVLKQMQPGSIEDIIAIIALYRPGPMDSIPDYIKNKKNPDKITYKVPQLKSILDVTYGCIVYQEQVMQICREVAGYSYGRADLVRRAMAKKQHDVMLKEREHFIHGLIDDDGNIVCEGAVRRGVNETDANELFDKMVSFASYAFNKAHAAAYAFISYQTAYLKCYYPKEFLAALMTCYMENTGKIIDYSEECSRHGINVLPPSVNMSTHEFRPTDNGVVFSMTAIKNTGKGFVDRMVLERESNGNFVDFFDFCSRMQGRDLNRRTIESLIKSGSFDNLGANRNQLLNSIDEVIDIVDNNARNTISGQIGFEDIGQPEIKLDNHYSFKPKEELPKDILLKFEKEVSGIYLSGHPMKEYFSYIKSKQYPLINEIIPENIKQDSKIKLIGLISSITKKLTKSNNTIAFLNFEDFTGSIEIIVFNKCFETYRQLLNEGNIVEIYGKADITDDNQVKIICEVITSVPSPDKIVIENNKRDELTNKPKGIFIRFDNSNSPQVDICLNLLSIFDGEIKTYFYFNDTKEYKFIQNTDINEPLINELTKILGKDNVILKD